MFQNFKHQIACIAVLGEDTDKNTDLNSPKRAISGENFSFFLVVC